MTTARRRDLVTSEKTFCFICIADATIQTKANGSGSDKRLKVHGSEQRTCLCAWFGAKKEYTWPVPNRNEGRNCANSSSRLGSFARKKIGCHCANRKLDSLRLSGMANGKESIIVKWHEPAAWRASEVTLAQSTLDWTAFVIASLVQTSVHHELPLGHQ